MAKNNYISAQYLWDRVNLYSTEYLAKNTEWRKGQSMFNALSKVCPLTAEIIRASEYDPYHRDSKLDEFKKKCFELWSIQDE